MLDQLLVTVSVTREEDLQLIALGLQSKMPANWDGINPLARYAAAGIAIKARTAPSKKTPAPRPARRPHTAHGGRTPDQAYASALPIAAKA